MKKMMIALVLFFSTNVFATEVYTCDFMFADSKLVIENDGRITLEGRANKYDCTKYYEPFFGSVVDLTKINCVSGAKEVNFYFTQYSENEIILAKDLIFSREVSCKK